MSQNKNPYKDVEHWLLRARGIEKRIESKELEMQRAYCIATKVTPTLKEVVVDGGQGNKNPLEDYIILQEAINEEIKNMMQTLLEIEKAIESISNNSIATVMTDYYINGKTWERIAEDLEKSTMTIYRKRDRGLKEIKKYLKLLDNVIVC